MIHHLERDVAAGVPQVKACLLDPTLALRCVPGVSVATVDGAVATGRIRLKQSAAPSLYALRVELQQPDPDPQESSGSTSVVFDGVAEEQRTGRCLPFGIRLTITPSGPARSSCTITADFPGGDRTRQLLDRLAPQVVRRLEDLAQELQERPAARTDSEAPPAPERRSLTALARAYPAEMRAGGAIVGATTVIVLGVWYGLRRRRPSSRS